MWSTRTISALLALGIVLLFAGFFIGAEVVSAAGGVITVFCTVVLLMRDCEHG